MLWDKSILLDNSGFYNIAGSPRLSLNITYMLQQKEK